jgi:beta-glucosidase
MIYKDTSAPLSDRVQDLLSQMTLPEKLAQMHSLWLVLSADGEHKLRPDASNRFSHGDPDHVRTLFANGLGQITRPLGSIGVDPREGVRALNRFQKDIIEGTRLGIPVMSHEECLSGLMAQGATLFPTPLAMAGTWNPELIERLGRAISAECRSVGCHQGLAPVLDVSRDVRWGRTEECFAEDPYLTGVFATTQVNPDGADGLWYDSAGGMQLVIAQAAAVAVTAVFAAIASFILLKLIDLTIGLRVDRESEIRGLDYAEHGEEGYILR